MVTVGEIGSKVIDLFVSGDNLPSLAEVTDNVRDAITEIENYTSQSIGASADTDSVGSKFIPAIKWGAAEMVSNRVDYDWSTSNFSISQRNRVQTFGAKFSKAMNALGAKYEIGHTDV